MEMDRQVEINARELIELRKRNWSQSKRQPSQMNKLQGTQGKIDPNENLIKDAAQRWGKKKMKSR